MSSPGLAQKISYWGAKAMSLENMVSSLQSLPGHARATLLSRARTMRVRRGQTLLVRGENSSQVFFVVEGKLSVVLCSVNGREVALREIVTGDFFGELAA